MLGSRGLLVVDQAQNRSKIFFPTNPASRPARRLTGVIRTSSSAPSWSRPGARSRSKERGARVLADGKRDAGAKGTDPQEQSRAAVRAAWVACGGHPRAPWRPAPWPPHRVEVPSVEESSPTMQPRFACRSASRVPGFAAATTSRSGFGVWISGGAERQVGPLLSRAIKRATSVLAFLERAAIRLH
jgi:hypothetical protein